MEFEYFSLVERLLRKVLESEKSSMEKSVELLYRCIRDKKTIYTFGASHAGIISEELFYRAGGLMLYNPIFARELMLDTSPVYHTSSMERLEGYGTLIAKDGVRFQAGDVLIAHSVSGRNPVALEIAFAAKETDASVIALTNLQYSKSVASRHSSGKRLFEIADIVLDNHGELGDASVKIEGISQKVAPTSTVVGATILNAITAELVRKLVEAGISNPPVFYSANMDGGDDLNKKLFDLYRDSIRYAFN